jgi:RimJ/RimL family protein N-acetyltransferase
MPVGFNHIELVGDKITLRPIRESDATDAYNLVTDEAILSCLAWDGPSSQEAISETYHWWEAELNTGTYYCLAIERIEQPGLIGCIDVSFPWHPQQAGIGYWLGVPYWNQGYMTEAVRLVCHLCFHYLDSARVYGTVFVGNTGSRRALEKNGFTLDGTLRSHVYKRGEFLDSWFLTLLRSEWEARREQYHPRHKNVVIVRGD